MDYAGAMMTLRFALPIGLACAWVMTAGCEDSRPVVNLPAGGEAAAGEGGTGESPEAGSSGQSGGAGATGGADQGGRAGAPDQGGTTDQGGEGGAPRGQGGQGGEGGTNTPECPSNLFGADGQDCTAFGDGFVCSDGGTDPCQFGNSIVCTFGVWERREAFPAPCGGAGGEAGTGTGGGT